MARIGPPRMVAVGATVDIDGSSSSDPDRDSLTYSWTFTSKPAASLAVITGMNGARASFVADVAGSISAVSSPTARAPAAFRSRV